jgi:cis-L-3-hydroxyproline dehydratase
MQLTRDEEAMLEGRQGPAKKKAMEGLLQLGRAFGAPRFVEIGYAHVHAGMALYLEDVELMEALAAEGATMAVPSSVNIANADMTNWRQTGAPEKLVRLQRRAESAHQRMGSACSFTCTPYWAGHWPTWNTHMTSIESTVTIFCNSVLGAKSNRDGFFAVYAAMTGRYPLFGYHVEENRRGTHLFHVDAPLTGTTDYSCLGFHIGRVAGDGVPVVTGLKRPTLDELDAMGAGMATSGGVALFIVPGVTPPFATTEQAFAGTTTPVPMAVTRADIDAVYTHFCTGRDGTFDIVHVGCPHASFEEMKEYASLLDGKKVAANVEFWVTTSRTVRRMAEEAGLLRTIEASGAKVISDTCPISCHFARTTSPDPALGVAPPPIRTVVIDSAKQAKYVRDMIQCDTLLTGTREAVATALTGRFVPRAP